MLTKCGCGGIGRRTILRGWRATLVWVQIPPTAPKQYIAKHLIRMFFYCLKYQKLNKNKNFCLKGAASLVVWAGVPQTALNISK